MRVRVLVAALATLALVASACGGGDDDAAAPEVEETTSTTLSVAEAAAAYTGPGPYPVGVTTLELEGAIPVEVWYPAVEGSTGEDTYDVRDLIPPSVSQLLTAEIPATFTTAAARDADVADGEFPLVLFSHGYTGFRQQSTFLTAHLASWGMIVAAPDHWSRDIFHTLDTFLGGTAIETNDSVDDLRLTRVLMEAEQAAAGSPFEGHVATNQIAAVGHSAGGGTVLGIAPDGGIAGYVSMASGARLGGPDAPASDEPLVLPDKPSLFLAGSLDGIVSAEETTRPSFDAATAPSRLWIIEGAGHLAFSDLCTFGNGSGIIGVAVASGLGPFLDAAPQFRSLGEDGCLEPAVSVEDTFPIVKHVVTSWLRELFGVDAVPVGLGPDVAGEYSVPVEIEENL